MDINLLRNDESKMEDGVWKQIGDTDIEIKFRSPQSEYYQRVKRQIEKKYAAKIRKKTITDEEKAFILTESLVLGGIVDWINFFDGDEEIKWSQEVGRYYLDIKVFPEFYSYVIDAFIETSDFYVDLVDSSKKTSLNILSGDLKMKA